MKVVHIIGSGPLQRYQQDFPDNCHNSDILKQLYRNKIFFGRSQTVMKVDSSLIGQRTGAEVPYPDHTSPYLLDDPETIVCIGLVNGKTFTETERLQGPPIVVDLPKVVETVSVPDPAADPLKQELPDSQPTDTPSPESLVQTSGEDK